MLLSVYNVCLSICVNVLSFHGVLWTLMMIITKWKYDIEALFPEIWNLDVQ